MSAGPELRTERLLLRRWQPWDSEPFAAMNADPRVMEHFPSTLAREQSDELIARIERRFEQDGFGFWAVQKLDGGELIGFVGLSVVTESLPFAPAVEVGWRLAVAHWKQGLAAEAARASLRYGFQQLGLAEILAYTAARNLPSRTLMERLGMRHDGGADFEHPGIAAGDPLAAHVVYRIAAPAHAAY